MLFLAPPLVKLYKISSHSYFEKISWELNYMHLVLVRRWSRSSITYESSFFHYHIIFPLFQVLGFKRQEHLLKTLLKDATVLLSNEISYDTANFVNKMQYSVKKTIIFGDVRRQIDCLAIFLSVHGIRAISMHGYCYNSGFYNTVHYFIGVVHNHNEMKLGMVLSMVNFKSCVLQMLLDVALIFRTSNS